MKIVSYNLQKKRSIEKQKFVFLQDTTVVRKNLKNWKIWSLSNLIKFKNLIMNNFIIEENKGRVCSVIHPA